MFAANEPISVAAPEIEPAEFAEHLSESHRAAFLRFDRAVRGEATRGLFQFEFDES